MIVNTHILISLGFVFCMVLSFYALVGARKSKTLILLTIAKAILMCFFLKETFPLEVISAIEEYQTLTDQKLVDFQQLRKPFNTKEGKYHEPLLIYADFSSYTLQPEEQKVEFKSYVSILGDSINHTNIPWGINTFSIRYHTNTPWGINTFLLEKYNTSLDDEIPICKMNKKDILELFRGWNKQRPDVLKFKISELKINNAESIHILLQNEDVDLRELVTIKSIKYAKIKYPILKLNPEEWDPRAADLILPEEMKGYSKY